MNFKKIYGLILGVIVAGLTSCSSDLNNEEKAPVSPNETAKRALSISTGDAKTRSEVRIDADNKWVTGDKFMAYNRTFTGSSSESRFGILTASSTGTRTTLDGVIACKDNDELGIFYPGTFVTGHDQGKMPVIMTASYINGNKGQDGSKENLKYFDYSYGKGKVTVNGASASGSVDMKKLYSVLELDFTVGGTKLTNIKKLVLSNVYTEAVYNIPNDKLEDYETGKIEVNSPVALEKVYVAILPQNHFSPTFEVYTTDNKAYRFAVSTPNFNLVAAKVYPFTVQVKEFTPEPVTPPYIEIGGVKWGKYNLQYSTGTKVNGWVDGYHLAENPWDYYMYTPSKITEPLSTLQMTLPSYNPNNVKFDHFRWGDIEYAYDYTKTGQFWTERRDIQGVISSDKKHGDLAAYASNNKWKLPSATDFNNLMKATGEYLGYFIDDNGNKVYGVLFDPNVAEGLKGKVLDKNNKVLGSSNTGAIINAGKNLRQFVKSDFDNALFFPMAGIYSDYTGYISKPGSQAGYWTSTSNPSNNNAAAFMPQNMSNSLGVYQGFSGSTQNALINKNNMHSIRPIYVGQ
ncbi:fimbrillin family protein [Prevotella jejuni]|uniref:fimbrillin family protein n=1 Tax=Prevotella jejuni TaxID=1177574 RepID=UPI001C5F269E|nr:fimbrillin family protein [Prevotella jejuni]MBW4772404.1 fimbrillin family protein [Prevotella jejuni]